MGDVEDGEMDETLLLRLRPAVCPPVLLAGWILVGVVGRLVPVFGDDSLSVTALTRPLSRNGDRTNGDAASRSPLLSTKLFCILLLLLLVLFTIFDLILELLILDLLVIGGLVASLKTLLLIGLVSRLLVLLGYFIDDGRLNADFSAAGGC